MCVCVCACVPAGLICDRLGRRWGMAAAGVSYIGSSCLMFVSWGWSYEVLLLGRLLMGVGAGIVYPLVVAAAGFSRSRTKSPCTVTTAIPIYMYIGHGHTWRGQVSHKHE